MLGKSFLATAAASFLLASMPVRAKNNLTDTQDFIMFGNSLSDDGNAWQVLNNTAYWQGHFTNGPVWSEYTAYLLNATFTDYAFGGATSSNNPAVNGTFENKTIPSYLDQIDAFLKNNTDIPHPDKDFVGLEIGSNNFLSFSDKPLQLLTNSSDFIDQISQDTVAGLDKLVDAGFRRFFVWGLPAIWLTPAIVHNKVTEHVVKKMINEANDKINDTLKDYISNNSDKIEYFHLYDVANLMQMAMEDDVLDELDINNVDDACYAKDEKTNKTTICDEPYKHFFYDEVHPSARIHYLAGVIANNYIQDSNYHVNKDEMIKNIQKYNIGDATAEDNILADNDVNNIGAYLEGSTQTSEFSEDDDNDGGSTETNTS